MHIRSIILGIAVTAVLLCVLVLTRVMVTDAEVKEFEIREVEIASLPEPPEPESLEQTEPEESAPPPPQLSVPDLSVSLDISQVALPTTNSAVDPKLTIDSFELDIAPSPLPVVPVARVKKSAPKVVKKASRTKTTVKRSKPSKSKPKPPKQPKAVAVKSSYSLNELDSNPRHLRSPSIRFPSKLRGVSSGRVVARIVILPSGKTKLVSILSSSHSALTPLAKKIANGSRFSVPRYKGKAVKVIRDWPIVIKK